MLLSVVVMRQSRWHIQSDMMFVQPWSSNLSKAPGKDGVVTGTDLLPVRPQDDDRIGSSLPRDRTESELELSQVLYCWNWQTLPGALGLACWSFALPRSRPPFRNHVGVLIRAARDACARSCPVATMQGQCATSAAKRPARRFQTTPRACMRPSSHVPLVAGRRLVRRTRVARAAGAGERSQRRGCASTAEQRTQIRPTWLTGSV